MNLGLFVLRIVVGLLFMGHGAQKLFGWFGGQGPEGTARVFDSIGLRPGQRHARLAGIFEFGGGALLVLGLLTPLASLVLTAVMVAAIATVHYSKGIWASDGGYEFNLVLIAAAFALAGAGPGNWSLDHALSIGDSGAKWAIGALVLGLLGAYGAVASGRQAGQPAPQSGSGGRSAASPT